jgi:ElaB/YqjD/DUF883 family membrane-anchored ribosome-binding protein
VNSQISTDQLLQDLRTVVHDAEALLRATAGQAGERVQEARTQAEASVRQARERIGELERNVTAQARAAAREADRYVRDNPWQSLGIAAGIAFLAGMLVARK